MTAVNFRQMLGKHDRKGVGGMKRGHQILLMFIVVVYTIAEIAHFGRHPSVRSDSAFIADGIAIILLVLAIKP